jgi:phosphoribosyl-ATP pyrophosphohydrolase/phosphoribosyl-AMP cyclohydrolase
MNLDFSKLNGLVPAIIQDAVSAKVLMLGFMNEEALAKTIETGQVTFFSRTKNRLWTKGEESGNFLNVVSIKEDCDKDGFAFLKYLQDFIDQRYKAMPEGSYTTSLFKSGVNRMAQKVGEEAVETVIEATNGTEEGFLYEASDLVYHLIVLLTSKGYRLDDLGLELKKRHK